MSDFIDPHYLGGAPQAFNRSGALPGTPVHLGQPVPRIINITGGSNVTIPFPVQATKGATPATFPYIVITNSSPFTMTVRQNTVLTVIAAYTQDVVQVPVPDGTAPLTAFLDQPTATVAFGVESSIYAIWYPNDPGGQYPAAIGSGSIPIGANSLLVGQDFGGGFFGTLDITPIPAWIQAIAVKPGITGSPPGGAYVLAADSFGIICELSVSDGQIFYIPVNGQPEITLTITAIGAAGIGIWQSYGLAGPVIFPFIQSFGSGNTLTPSGSFNFNVAVNGGAVTTLVAAPPYGFQIRVRHWAIHFVVAPVAGTQVLLRSTTAAANLSRFDLAGAINQPNGPPLSCDFWVPNQLAGGIATPDGLDGQNTSAQVCTFTGVYEIWPTPMAPM